MGRRKKPEEHVNHERWLVSYADFITLLFAFFVVMFAVSQVDSKKVGRFSESFQEALEGQVFDSRGRGILPGDTAAASAPHAAKPHGSANGDDFVKQKTSIRDALSKRAIRAPALSGLKFVDARGELVLRMPDRLMFGVGDATLSADGKSALAEITEELAERPVRVRIEGHTDDAPIHTARFPTNWELSTARATAVVSFIVGTKLVAPERLSAAGYGEYHPAASNDTSEGRAQNRRVDIVVLFGLDANKETTP